MRWWDGWRQPGGRAGGVLLALWVGVLGALLGPLAHAQEEALDINPAAAVRVEAEVQQPGGAWQRVSLPYRWMGSQAQEPARLHLRLHFVLEDRPNRMWALRFDRLPADHIILLNSQRVHGDTPGTQPPKRFSLAPHWVELPPALMREGDNLLELSAPLANRNSGVTVPRIGPAELLYQGYHRAHFFAAGLPQALNMAAAGLALFTLLVWWFRRSERTLGLFGALWLMVSLRNIAYYADGNLAGLSVGAGDLLFYLIQVGSIFLLLELALVISGRTWALMRKLIWAMPLLALGVGLAAAATDRLALARLLVYPVLICALGASIVMIWRAVRTPRHRVGLGVGAVFILVAVGHDYLLGVSSLFSVSDTYWVPYVSPLVIAGAGLAVLGRFVRALDSTELHSQELELRVAERTRALQMANAGKTRFVAAASHDLRQPVASIGLLSGLLREQIPAGAGRMVLDRLIDSVNALESLLKGLLDLSRFDAGTVVAKAQVVSLDSLFDAIASHEREAARAKGLAWRMRARGLAVHADPVLLEQVLRNLVTNAVRYTEQGGVLLAARRRGDHVLVQVWDSGCGIPEDRQESVFDEFVQLDNPARERARGMGLGLALVKRAVDLMGVPLQLRSRVGRGSCFSLWLPAAHLVQRRAVRPAAGSAALQGRRLWVVDDDEGVRESLRLRLEGWGAKVQVFAGMTAVRTTLSQAHTAPELLITDQRLPDGDGVGVAEMVQAQHASTPVLVITGDTAPADLARLSSRRWPVLHKPFDADVLFNALSEALAKTRKGASSLG